MDYLKFEHIKCSGCGRFIIRKDFLIASNHETWCEIAMDLEG